MKKIIVPIVLVLAVLAVVGIRLLRSNGVEYRMLEVTRGDVRSVVTSTGTLQAITTVEVGTQVSGKVSKIYVDFNDRVTRGQLIARIDPVLLELAVRSAEADLARYTAELTQAQRDFNRIARLFEADLVAESEYNSAQYKVDVATATLQSAEVSLERARQNLDYTEIRAPVDGVVLDRLVDEGQTVAASLTAPQLFLIAEDLSKMEIVASVDESDIGRVADGMAVDFTVQAYPDSTFHGKVNQVRLNSTISENVVNYVVSIVVDNPGGRLLPGMTATVEFIVAEAKDVLRVSNAALRFRPTGDMLATLPTTREPIPTAGTTGEGSRGQHAGRPPEAVGTGTDGGLPPDSDHRAVLWTLDDQGQPTILLARTGITDGQYTEVTGRDVGEGTQVIASIVKSATTSSSSPFQGGEQSRRMGPPPGM